MTRSIGQVHPVTVGVDGSASALHAVRWAAAVAARRHLPLRLVHGHVWGHTGYPGAPAPPQDFYDALLEQARQWLRQAEDAACEVAPGLAVEQELSRAAAIPALLEQSEQARLLVLGSRGIGGFTGLLVGSTAVALAAHGHCPVAVVRGRTAAAPPPEYGPVVVGVDGSPASESAIAFAFDEASLRNAALVAVHTWSDVAVNGPFETARVILDWDAVAQDEQRLLAQRMAGWQEKYPDVAVERVLTRDRPVRSLLAQSRYAQLIVVGSRGRGGFTGMVLGSTSQALLHHAPCPVVVVRPEASA